MTNMAAYNFGVKIGRFLKGVVVIAALVFLIGAAYGNGKRVAEDSQPKAEKIVKHKQAKKKNCCKCVDKPVKISNVNLDEIGKELNAKIILSGRN